MLIKYFHNQAHRPGPIWFFDLDNTLHNASWSVFKTLHHKMTQAVMHSLQVSEQEAAFLRTKYLEKYGATVIGLSKHHHIDRQEFLRLSHDFNVQAEVLFEHNLPALLKRLPGTLYVLTNAPQEYAERVLHRLNIHSCFKGICAIDHMILQGRHKTKPSLALMRQLQAHLQEPSKKIIFVEDTLRNLKAAKTLGWQTVYIYNSGSPLGKQRALRPSYVDYRFNNLRQLLLSPHMYRS
ncbi:pyrimidine 5'-nucleotidase [Brackiella oedipodis]|uniref:pyrimidine 5'-nucleotidase n=1 Tax=Brackiella oedipodis TaxID=124225 RepID=UPI0006863DAD|nr:pyrimidine 5'-nucleotidase [Brackiella oedipodis]